MVTGWKKISGKYYYFNKTTGKMAKSKWIGKYYVNAKGIRTKKK
jgi:glucan-binding YG repeat protein